jgi:hypothetical protein
VKAIKTGCANAEKNVMRIAVLFIFLALLGGSAVEAQIDPSSAMLLSPGKVNVRDGGLDSGRYTVKPKSDVHPVRKSETRPRIEEPAPTPTPTPTLRSSETATATATATVNGPPQLVGPQKPPQKPPQKAPQQVSPQEPGPQFSPQEANEPQYVRPVRDERRNTMLEISFAPGYMYNDSKSTFAPRNYFINSPAAALDASVWVNPNFGVHTSFTGTLNANVSDSLNNTKNATASSQWFSAGAKARSFFGDGSKAPVLQFGVDYREYTFKTPSDSLLRNKLTTSGLHLLIDAELPTSGFGSWTLGGEFGPKLSHRESSNAIEFRSGQDPQATTVEVHLGAKYRFNQANTMFWKVSYGVERDLFSGSTTINDPLTGQPQTDVAVTNTFTLFQLGYSWGN